MSLSTTHSRALLPARSRLLQRPQRLIRLPTLVRAQAPQQEERSLVRGLEGACPGLSLTTGRPGSRRGCSAGGEAGAARGGGPWRGAAVCGYARRGGGGPLGRPRGWLWRLQRAAEVGGCRGASPCGTVARLRMCFLLALCVTGPPESAALAHPHKAALAVLPCRSAPPMRAPSAAPPVVNNYYGKSLGAYLCLRGRRRLFVCRLGAPTSASERSQRGSEP